MLNFLKFLFTPITATLRFIQTYFKSIVFLTILFIIFGGSEPIEQTNPNLQKINLTGAIMNSEKILEDIYEAKNDPHIKGVLLNVNSPGGAVAPSIEIAYALKELKETKPVIAYASGTMASGSYYASIWTNEIIANPGSMIGSIGVIFQGANVEELMQTLGIKTQTLKAGKFKESGTPTREWTAYEKEELTKVIQDTYKIFVEDVANARNLNPENHTQFADAHIFTARQAKEVKLIDEVGTISLATKRLQELANVKKVVWKKPDKFEEFMDKMIQESISKFSVYFFGGLKAI